MANPFLVLGGIAVGIVTAAFGVLQVPGWVGSAQDASAINDLANIRDSQAVLRSTNGAFTSNFATLSGGTATALAADLPVATLALAHGGDGHFAPTALAVAAEEKNKQITFELSPGNTLEHLGVNTSGDAYCAVIQSASGKFFAVAEGQTISEAGDTASNAMDGAVCLPDTRPAVDPGEPEVPAWGTNDIVFRIDTTLSGCTAPGVKLTGNGATVNWGDGTSEPLVSTGNKHTFETPGVKDIVVTGKISRAQMMANATSKCITEVPHWGADTGFQDASSMFYGANNLTSVAKPPATVEDMSSMFSGANKFNSPVNDWDVSSVKYMSSMFSGARSFNQPVDKWNTGNVGAMNGMFQWAEAFDQDLPWDVKKVRSMGSMFDGAKAFNGDVSKWETNALTNTASMFKDAVKFNRGLDHLHMDNVDDLTRMFSGAVSFNQDLNSWKTGNIESLYDVFSYASSFNGDIADWDVSKVKSMESTFRYASSFNKPVGRWDVENVTTMTYTFANASSFNQPLGEWKTSNVRDMSRMFENAASFNQPIGNWDVSQVATLDYLFSGSSSFNQPLGDWKITSAESFWGIFGDARSFDHDISSWYSPILAEFAKGWEVYDTESFIWNNKLTIDKLPAFLPR